MTKLLVEIFKQGRDGRKMRIECNVNSFDDVNFGAEISVFDFILFCQKMEIFVLKFWKVK